MTKAKGSTAVKLPVNGSGSGAGSTVEYAKVAFSDSSAFSANVFPLGVCILLVTLSGAQILLIRGEMEMGFAFKLMGTVIAFWSMFAGGEYMLTVCHWLFV